MQLQVVIIGEAAGRVSEAVREKIAGVPFANIVRMRNRLVHHYFRVDPDLVWDVVAEDLSPLIREIEAYLSPPAGSPADIH